MPRPNILYIHSHDTGRFVQPYGHAVPTPAIQRLAEQGVLFRQAFCSSPSCSASRASLLTGQCAHSSGMLGLAHLGWKLNDYSQHIVHTLRRAGYTSTLAGLQHIATGPEPAATIGYDHDLGPASNRVRDVAPSACKYLEEAANRQGEPFFLDVGFSETHTMPDGRSLFGCEPGDPRWAQPAPPLPDTPRTRQDMADFKVAAGVLDEGIGQVLDALERTGLASSTLVICTTDHGLPLPAMKCNLNDWGTGVMLILRGPGEFSGGKVLDALTSHIDVLPTVYDWIDIEPPAHLQGRSLLPVLRGEAEEVNEAIFTEVTHHAAYEPQRAVRTKRWKYVRRFEDRDRPVLPNCDDSPSKDVWVEAGWRERRVESEQLYDLTFDPNEVRNVAADAALAPVLAEMRERLDRWMRATDDPLLRGPVPIPPGVVQADPDDLSPQARRRR